MGKSRYLFCCVFFFLLLTPVMGFSEDINGLYPPMEIEPELLAPLKIEGMVFVKGGCFDMGDTFGEGNPDERPVHKVCVDDFYMGKYEVTQQEWKDLISWSNSSRFNKCDKCPVENVSYYDVQRFIKKLNRKTGRRYSLPTEAEWEYAAREGGRNIMWAGTSLRSRLGEYAWYEDNSGRETHPVGQKKPNAIGLFDMSGNVSEWVNDWYGEDYYKESYEVNPIGPSNGKYRVLRGGSWSGTYENVRMTKRNWTNPDDRYAMFGFRLSLSAQD